jgi:hypothetical protein
MERFVKYGAIVISNAQRQAKKWILLFHYPSESRFSVSPQAWHHDEDPHEPVPVWLQGMPVTLIALTQV